MAAAGFLYDVVIDGILMGFKDVSCRESAPPINASSRSNPDGSTNEGFSSFESDLSTLTIDINQIAETPNGLPDLTLGINDVAWNVDYNGVNLYSGESLYVEEWTYSGSAPGEARVRLLAHANGPYS